MEEFNCEAVMAYNLLQVQEYDDFHYHNNVEGQTNSYGLHVPSESLRASENRLNSVSDGVHLLNAIELLSNVVFLNGHNIVVPLHIETLALPVPKL
jgi:hypothetical protein